MNKLQTKEELFLELAGGVSDDGFTREVFVSEFSGKYARLQFGNGADWARTDGTVGKKYKIVRKKEKNRIVSVQLNGLNDDPTINRTIRSDIKRHYEANKCVVLGNSREIQVDHKDGRYKDKTVSDLQTQSYDDFQSLSSPVNYAKRQHCKICRETGIRFDAQRLGYSVSQIKGGGLYNGSCEGCYWFDPKQFNSVVSRNFMGTKWGVKFKRS